MLIGDLGEVLCGLLVAGATYLILSTFAPTEMVVGFTLLVVAVLVGYLSHVHGGVPLKQTEETEDSAESS